MKDGPTHLACKAAYAVDSEFVLAAVCSAGRADFRTLVAGVLQAKIKLVLSGSESGTGEAAADTGHYKGWWVAGGTGRGPTPRCRRGRTTNRQDKNVRRGGGRRRPAGGGSRSARGK
jgi:hypothetical protein